MNENEMKENSTVQENETEVTNTESETSTVEPDVKDFENADTDIKAVRNSRSKVLLGVVIVLSALLIGLLCYIGITSQSPNNVTKAASTKANKNVLIDALNNLKRKDTFLISTYVSAPMGDSSYLDYVTPEFSATLLDEANMQTPYQDIDFSTAHFEYNDMIKDGHMYFFYKEQVDENKTKLQTYISPDNYVKECEPRKYMFFDVMKDNITDIEFVETTDIDLGNGPVSMDVYKGVLDASIVKKILGNGTVTLYNCVKESTNNAGLQKIMGWLIDDIDFTLVYSNANILVGVVDDTLAYINLEIGGLGTKMYVTKCYIENVDDIKKIEVPSTEGAITYENLYSDFADMALNYNSMEEMYNALNNTSSLTEEELQQMLDNAVQESNETETPTTDANATENKTTESTVTATPTPTSTPTGVPESETNK